jgi:hypothetical protein
MSACEAGLGTVPHVRRFGSAPFAEVSIALAPLC